MGWDKAGRRILHLLWPQTCAHCREDLAWDEGEPLCPRCRLELVSDDSPGGSEGPGACRLIRSPYLYRGAAVTLVHAFKFRGRRSAARVAGEWMGREMPRFPELGRPDALVPVPLHPRRQSQRGFNQARLLADGLSQATGIPVLELLRRLRNTRPQWTLGREERLRNLRGVFAALSAARGKRLLLIDDVCTTGASLESCAQVLLESGTAWVGGYAFARQGQAAPDPAI